MEELQYSRILFFHMYIIILIGGNKYKRLYKKRGKESMNNPNRKMINFLPPDKYVILQNSSDLFPP